MSGWLRQTHTAVACSFGILVMGALNVWTSYTASLYSSNTTTPLAEPMTRGEESLLGSLPSLGAMLGTVAVGPVINMMGRRNGGVLLSIPFVISWIIISMATTTKLVLAARFLSGVPGGAFQVLSPVFIAEVTEDSIRGTLASVPLFFYYVGVVVSYIMGWFLTYKTIIWLNVVLSIVCTLLMILVVESPVFLLRQERDEDARLAIAKYRGVALSSVVVADELSRLRRQTMPDVELITVKDAGSTAEEAEKEMLNTENIERVNQSISPIKLLFMSPASRRGFFVVLFTITMQILMGIVPVQVYAKTVFTQTDPGHADLYTVLLAITLLSAGALTIVVADKVGRRILLIGSSVLVGVCLFALGFLIQKKDTPVWVTVFLILAYCFSFMLGAGSIPYVLLTEVFITEVQSIASIIIIEWVWFLNFFIIGVFPYMMSAFGIHGAFFTFACTGVANAVIGYLILPETKGLSKEQIQQLLVRRKKK